MCGNKKQFIASPIAAIAILLFIVNHAAASLAGQSIRCLVCVFLVSSRTKRLADLEHLEAIARFNATRRQTRKELAWANAGRASTGAPTTTPTPNRLPKRSAKPGIQFRSGSKGLNPISGHSRGVLVVGFRALT